MGVGLVEIRKSLLRERGGTMRFWYDFVWSWSGTCGCERKDLTRWGAEDLGAR